MRELDPKRLTNPLAISWTVLVLIFSAILGFFLGMMALLYVNLNAAAVLGPLAMITAVPLIIAQTVFTTLGAIVFVPLWAVLGGWLFARGSFVKSSGTELGVTLFSETHPIHQRVNELAQQLDLPPIKWVGWFPDDQINAFARGLRQSEAVVAFSRGAITKLSKPQLDAVMAHELAHVASHDMARMTYAYGVQRALTWFLLVRGLKRLARWLFTPLSQLEIMRFSRSREYWADAVGAALVSDEAMIGALRAISYQQRGPQVPATYAHFMFQNDLSNLFSTHPALDARINALNNASHTARLPFKAEQKKPPMVEPTAPPVAQEPAPVDRPAVNAPSAAQAQPQQAAVTNGLSSFGS